LQDVTVDGNDLKYGQHVLQVITGRCRKHVLIIFDDYSRLPYLYTRNAPQRTTICRYGLKKLDLSLHYRTLP